MSSCVGAVTFGTTGSPITVSGVGFTPTEVEFFVGAKTGSSAALQIMRGAADGTNQWYLDDTFDGTNRKSITGTNKCISVYEWNGSNYAEVLSATFHSFTADGFKVNVTIANSDYQVKFLARN